MKINVSANEIFIHYGQRSIDKYHLPLCKHVSTLFQAGTFQDALTVKKIVETYYDWCADTFQKIIQANNDMLFVNYLFAYHESSILLWLRTLAKENLQGKFGINEEDLSLNRRIFKLALEQACEINYTNSSSPSIEIIQQYDIVIEDLLYIGEELYHAAQFLAELRIFPGSLQASIEVEGLLYISRKGELDPVFDAVFCKMKDDFEKGIMDTEGVKQLKGEVKKCFGIDYDFAAHQIVLIKKHHNSKNWEFQTIEPGILVQNLINTGVSQQNAEKFYNGLTLNKENKLSLKDSVYKVNSMERHFFRPILEISQNGKRRQLIGIQKWGESITVLATNNFQWNKAPAEWKQNICFQQYLERKSAEHDSMLEDEVEKILHENEIFFFRNITSFNDGKNSVSINIASVGEIDFIWLDTKYNKIVVADCKYNRARYDMIAFSSDYTNFKDSYETKIANKVKWVDENRDVVYSHFERQFTGLNITIEQYEVEKLFIINTPTFYMYMNRVNTVCFFNLEEFILKGYMHPDIILRLKNGNKTTIKLKPYPYF
jgi:hypothetical protein